MRFTCLRENLLTAITAVSRVVPQRHANAALEGILLHAGRTLQLSGYNMETGITMELEGQISVRRHRAPYAGGRGNLHPDG